MKLQRMSVRPLVASLFLAACADETLDDSLDTEATGGSYEALQQAARVPHCRRGRGWSHCAPEPAHDAATPAPGCHLPDGGVCAPPTNDVCARSNGGCSQICASTGAGTRSCSCQPGWTLQADGTTCLNTPPPVFTVTGAVGKGGSVTASSLSGTCNNAGVNWSCQVPAGGSVVVTAMPASNWRTRDWTCPAGVGGGDTMNIANVQANSDCFVAFIPITFSTAYQAVDATGALLPGLVTAYNVARGPCTDDLCRSQQGETVVLTAGVAFGLRFVGWSGCADSKVSPLSFVVTSDQTCVAHYESLPILL